MKTPFEEYLKQADDSLYYWLQNAVRNFLGIARKFKTTNKNKTKNLKHQIFSPQIVLASEVIIDCRALRGTECGSIHQHLRDIAIRGLVMCSHVDPEPVRSGYTLGVADQRAAILVYERHRPCLDRAIEECIGCGGGIRTRHPAFEVCLVLIPIPPPQQPVIGNRLQDTKP